MYTQSKQGKAVLIFLICLTSVEGFSERARQLRGEAIAGEARTLQNQRSIFGDLKPSNNGQERRISQHIYDKRSFRTGSIAHADTRTGDLLTTTEENVREFRLQEDRRLTQPTYRLLNSRNRRSEYDSLRTIRERVSKTEEQRTASPSENVERASYLERSRDTSRRHLEQPHIHFSRNDNTRISPDRYEDRASRIGEGERKISFRNTAEPNKESLDARRANGRDTSSRSRFFQQRSLDSRTPEVRESANQEDVRFPKLDTIREDSRESRTQGREAIEPGNSRTFDHMRTIDNTPDMTQLHHTDRRIPESRFSIDLLDEVRVTDNMDRRQFLDNNKRSIDVTNANQIERSRSPLGDQSRRYQPIEARNREVDTRKTVPENININQIPRSSRKMDSRQFRKAILSKEERCTIRSGEITRRDVPNNNRRVQVPAEASRDHLLYRKLEDNRFRILGSPYSRHKELHERRYNDILRSRASAIESSRQDQPLHFDRRSLQRSRSLEDIKLLREDLLRSSRREALRPNREQNVAERRFPEQSLSLKSDEVREDGSRNSRQGRDTERSTMLIEECPLKTSDFQGRLERIGQLRMLGYPEKIVLWNLDNMKIPDEIGKPGFKNGYWRQNEDTHLLERRNMQRNMPLESTTRSRESREDDIRETRNRSDYTRQLRINPDYRREADRFNTRVVRQNFENHFRRTRSMRYRENNRTYRQKKLHEVSRVVGRFSDQVIRHTQGMRRSEIQRDDRRAISSGMDSPRRENRIAYNNFTPKLNTTATTRRIGESRLENDGQEANLGVWVETIKLALAVFLLGQIFVGSSEKYKLRIKNVISTLRLKKEKVQ
nr:unnamed protein product [Callosobruchus analis]